MNKDLVEKGSKIVEQLSVEDHDILKQWMAHYVAELMEAAKTDDQGKAELAADRCAELILKLWELKATEELVQTSRRIGSLLGQAMGDKEEFEQHCDELRDALVQPEAATMCMSARTGITLWHLSDLEHSLISLLFVSESLSDSDTERLSEGRRQIVQRETETHEIRQRVARVFPALEKLSLTDQVAVREQVTRALRSVAQLRHRLMWDENANTPEV